VSDATQIVLVGLPGSGKSTVGSILAASIGWKFIDLDAEIEVKHRLTVAEIFAQLGEAQFRRYEADLTERLASETEIVLAPGGGWITNPELPRLLARDAVMVWLRVHPETALVRLRASGVTRPLLQVRDATARIHTLLDDRHASYEQAHFAVDTDDLTPHQVAETIVEWLRRPKKNVSLS
jgi:shikimate kinase